MALENKADSKVSGLRDTEQIT